MKKLIVFVVILNLTLSSILVLTYSTNVLSQEPFREPTTFDIWFESPLNRVGKLDSSSLLSSYSLSGAKGEYESFQLIVKALNESLESVTVQISNFSSGASIISSENVVFFFEHYVEVVNSTRWSPYPPQEYPDALIPFFDPLSGSDIEGARFDGYPFSVTEGQCQPVWVDVFIPRDAQAGVYTATISVHAYANESEIWEWGDYQISLEVWDFALPEVPSMQSFFGVYRFRFKDYYNLTDSPEDKERLDVLMSYCMRELVDHRLMPSDLTDVSVTPHLNGTPDWSTPDSIKWMDEMMYWIDEVGVNAVDFSLSPVYAVAPDPLDTDRQKVINWIQGIYSFFENNGWQDLLYIYLFDEPNEQWHYEAIRDYSDLLHEAEEDLRVLVTESFTPDNASWGSLVGSIDIWCPHFETFSESQAQERLDAGDEIWTYTALAQTTYAPKWQLDYPLLHYRIPTWINRHYGATGLLEWCTNFWRPDYDPWTETISWYGEYDLPFNKEGELFYPGVEAGIDVPVASIRLKTIRDSVEDYEYMQILTDLGLNEECLEIVDSIASGWSGWTKTPNDIQVTRDYLASMIVQALATTSTTSYSTYLVGDEFRFCGWIQSGIPEMQNVETYPQYSILWSDLWYINIGSNAINLKVQLNCNIADYGLDVRNLDGSQHTRSYTVGDEYVEIVSPEAGEWEIEVSICNQEGNYTLLVVVEYDYTPWISNVIIFSGLALVMVIIILYARKRRYS